MQLHRRRYGRFLGRTGCKVVNYHETSKIAHKNFREESPGNHCTRVMSWITPPPYWAPNFVVASAPGKNRISSRSFAATFRSAEIGPVFL